MVVAWRFRGEEVPCHRWWVVPEAAGLGIPRQPVGRVVNSVQSEEGRARLGDRLVETGNEVVQAPAEVFVGHSAPQRRGFQTKGDETP